MSSARSFLDRGLRGELLSTQEHIEQFVTLAQHARLVVSSGFYLILAMVAGTPFVSVAPMRRMTLLMVHAALATAIWSSMTRVRRLTPALNSALTDEARLRERVTRITTEHGRRGHESFDHLVDRLLRGRWAVSRP